MNYRRTHREISVQAQQMPHNIHFSHPSRKNFQNSHPANKVSNTWIREGRKLPVDVPHPGAGGIHHLPVTLPDL